MIFDSSKVPVSIPFSSSYVQQADRRLSIFYSRGVAASASAWTPLVFDTLVLGLTIYRTYSGIRNPTVGRTMWILLKAGVMYYRCVIHWRPRDGEE